VFVVTVGVGEITWDHGSVSVVPALGVEPLDDPAPARLRLDEALGKLRSEVDEALSRPAYDPDAFDGDEPFRITPG